LRSNFLLKDSLGNAVSYYANILRDNERGMLISVFSTRPLEPIFGDKKSYGVIAIYDAVGNLVQENLYLQKANDFDSTTYGLVWDCTNMHRRRIGGGTYLMKLRIRDTDGIARLFSKKIGVRF
jgi:hypothetical protein